MTTAFTVASNLINKGFRILGEGYYSAVYESNYDPNLVYKIGRTLDDPFLVYVSDTEIKNNIHFPKLYDLYIDNENDWYLAKMECLTPLPDHKKTVAQTIESYAKDQINSVALSNDMKYLLERIYNISEQHDFKLDLHEGNIMMRGVTPVITDPLAEKDLYTHYDMSHWLSKRCNAR